MVSYVNLHPYTKGSCLELYGKGKPYACFCGKEVTTALAKFSKDEKLANTKWLYLAKDERALLTKWEKVFANKYPEVGVIADTENLADAPADDGMGGSVDAYSTSLGLSMFERGHINMKK